MDFRELQNQLRNYNFNDKPGQSAQFKMAPLGRQQTQIDELDLDNVKKAAVLIPFINTGHKAQLILTKRTEYAGVHSGQISFPGGRKEEYDANYQSTALRETHEEIGVAPGSIAVVGSLSPLFIPPSNFYVQAFLGVISDKVNFLLEEKEVQEIIRVDLSLLLSGEAEGEFSVQTQGFKMKVPGYKFGPHVVWGATAMMISELKYILSNPT